MHACMPSKAVDQARAAAPPLRTRAGTLARTQIGTPHYMPPEVWKGRPYSFTSDSWALGCMLYEMAALKVPFEARSMSELKFKVTGRGGAGGGWGGVGRGVGGWGVGGGGTGRGQRQAGGWLRRRLRLLEWAPHACMERG
jgi:hypothetical protein